MNILSVLLVLSPNIISQYTKRYLTTFNPKRIHEAHRQGYMGGFSHLAYQPTYLTFLRRN
jgi:hypothetical protein